ncbi:MAG: ubiquinol-cytochrome c reductase iron-sulfur subunit N-terminal domain-containing protein, partial [Candidatus Nucleicultricaceae bacterium]
MTFFNPQIKSVLIFFLVRSIHFILNIGIADFYIISGENVSVESDEKKLHKSEPSRRDFLILTSSAIGAVGA